MRNEADTSNNCVLYFFHQERWFSPRVSIYWTLSLDDYRYEPDPKCENQSHAIPEMQKLMSNVMEAVALIAPTGTLFMVLACDVPSGPH